MTRTIKIFGILSVLALGAAGLAGASELTGGLNNQGVVPIAPANVSANKTGNDEITVSWTAVAGVEGYKIYRSKDGSEPVLVASIGETTYQDTNLANGTYVYEVQSYLGDLNSDPKQSDPEVTIEVVNENPPSPPPSGGGGGGSTSDTTPPTNPSIVIAGGAGTTASQNVILTLSAGEASQMAISNEANFAGGTFEPYATSKNWTLSSGDGSKTVYVKFRDSAGNTTAAVSDTISLGAPGSETGGELEQGGQVLGATVTNAHPGGTLVLDDATIYLIQNGKRHGFRTPEEYFSYGYNFAQAVAISEGDQSLSEGEIVKAMEGTLALDKTDNRTIYMIGGNGIKRGFTSAAVFTGLGYSFKNIPKIDLSDYETGPVIDSTEDAHPDGALILDNNGTVWWIRNSQRQGFQSEQIFNTYGFSFTKVVSTNTADLALSEAPLVKFRDGTLVDDDGTIYLISDGKKLGFKSMNALTARGYQLKNAIAVSLQSYEAGQDLQ